MWKASVVFRADASVTIGAGHVMRCLALADALKNRGACCVFLCRHITEALGVRINAAGHTLLRLPDASPGCDDLAHSSWLGTSMAQDAKACRLVLEKLEPDWLIVDHYALDARWISAVRGHAKVLVLDDLGDRILDADLLVDVIGNRRLNVYDGLLPPGFERLCGPMYAPLRPEFAALRQTALDRRKGGLHRVLVAMGGMDPMNATSQVLPMLSNIALQADIVLGSAAPHLNAVRAQISQMPHSRLWVDTPEIASLMAEADIAISAAGGTALECCALGLPLLTLVLADNQNASADALVKLGAAMPLGILDQGLPLRLADTLEIVSQPPTLIAMSKAAASITDGRGAARVVDAMVTPLTLQPATSADAMAVWEWRAAVLPGHFRAGRNPPLAHHLGWWEQALEDPNRVLLMAKDQAHLRLDLIGDSAVVSILVAPKSRGLGIGKRLLAILEPVARSRGLSYLTAVAAAENAASVSLFRAAGYTEVSVVDGFHHFIRSLKLPPQHTHRQLLGA